ncbi:MAG: hypothetical protein R3246_04595 [Acidimicrobiia bacterium]|nr:hypothetical protein [Acidimicrobiia bacterium]
MNAPRAGVAGLLLLAACSAPPSLEPYPGPTWTDSSGAAVPTDVVAIYADDCPGRESAGFLDVRWPLDDVPGVEPEFRRYVRDPEGVMPPRQLLAPYDQASSLPREARFTGLETEEFGLWAGADDDVYLYIVYGTRVEALPRAADDTIPCE